MRSPDVKDFLQMDKSKNFSDASEDEDDKVGIWTIIMFLIYNVLSKLSLYFSSCLACLLCSQTLSVM